MGDNTSNLAIMMLLAAWFTKNNYVPKCGILFVASSGEEGLGNLKGVRQLMKDYEGKIAVHVALDVSLPPFLPCFDDADFLSNFLDV